MPKPAGTAVRGDAAVVGHEIVLRILGGDAALQGVRVDADVVLRRHAALRRADARAGGDADLRLDEIDAGDALGDRVLDLDARVDLDEIEPAGVGVLQELDRAGGAVVHGAADLERRLAQLAPLRVGQEHGRRALDHLLVAPLHGAVALVQMHQVAVRVAEDLHLDVPRAAHQLLEVDLVLAEGRLGLAPRGRDRLDEPRSRPRRRACRVRRRPSSP